jgi:two-component system, NtrC family, sensor kinase
VSRTSELHKPLGLRIQILVGLGAVTGFAMLSTGYLALWAAGESVVGQREAAVRAVATGTAGAAAAVVDLAQPIGEAQNRARLAAALRGLEAGGDLTAVEVYGLDRRLALARPPRPPQASSSSSSSAEPPAPSPLLGGVLSGIGPALQYGVRPGDEVTELSAYAPIIAGGRVVGAVRVALDAPQPLATVIGRSGWLLVLLAAIDGLLVVGLGFWVLTRLVVRPMQEMQSATARVSAGDWEQKIDTGGPREVAALASSLNQMTASLVLQREQLIRSEKLASVGQLAAGVAHEIGNPLAAVLGYVDILRADAASPEGVPPVLGPAERRDALQRVKAETQRIHRIIQDLLAYSRPTKEEAEPTDPRKVLRGAEALLAPQARWREVKLVAVPDDPGWPRVLASAGRLTQVFVNLLLNAADAMKGRGVVTVKCDANARQVRLSFQDEGPGVTAEVARKIFDPFFTTKDPGHGTGLGLSISRSIIESYHGTLELLPPTPGGRGANFVITLPVAGTTALELWTVGSGPPGP